MFTYNFSQDLNLYQVNQPYKLSEERLKRELISAKINKNQLFEENKGLNARWTLLCKGG